MENPPIGNVKSLDCIYGKPSHRERKIMSYTFRLLSLVHVCCSAVPLCYSVSQASQVHVLGRCHVLVDWSGNFFIFLKHFMFVFVPGMAPLTPLESSATCVSVRLVLSVVGGCNACAR